MSKMSFLFVIIILLSCKAWTQRTNYAKKEEVAGVIVYEYSKQGSFYCEIQSHILVNNSRKRFYDVRNVNSSILHKYKNLQKDVGSDTLYSHFDLEPDSSINLNFSSFKMNSYNRSGMGTISSNSFFQKENESDKLYIAFNFKGEVIHYFGISLFKNENEFSSDDCCPRKNIGADSEFIVLVKCIQLSALDSEQKIELKLLYHSVEDNRIEMFYCE